MKAGHGDALSTLKCIPEESIDYLIFRKDLRISI